MNRIDQFKQIQNEGLELFLKKNSDYGDAFAKYGTIGVLIRIGDKISRLINISNKNISLVNDESMKDTLIDLHNYAAMALMLLNENDLVNLKNDKIINNDSLSNISSFESFYGDLEPAKFKKLGSDSSIEP